ncbi:hypothetical protein [Nostoc sp.]|uniref:hypothetical protein n=1 Tax=Nostoc sp. TaxID=1180 RepID=UPI002FF62DDE
MLIPLSLIDFNGGGRIRNNNESLPSLIEKQKNDQVFLGFTEMMMDKIKNPLDKEKGGQQGNNIQNLHTFTKVVMNYLTDKDNYSTIIPDLIINNVYVTNPEGFMLSYPFTNDKYDKNIILENRHWYKSAHGTEYKLDLDDTDGTSALSGVYIDINNKKNPNAIRTLWSNFKTKDGKEYTLCVDLFFDKTSNLSKEINLLDLNLLEQSIKSGLNLKEGDNIWIYLLCISFILALLLTLIYEFKVKEIILRISKRYPNDLVKIKLQLDDKHYASKDAQEIKFVIQGETKEINKSEQSREAKWGFSIQNIQVGVNKNQSHTRQQEATYSYELTHEYKLSMSENKPQYRCIETWKVVLESQLRNTQKIGFFVAKWNTNNSVEIEEGLDIKSIYWEKEYEQYLVSIKIQLREHLLISDDKEFVAVLDTNYSKRQNIPPFIAEMNSIKKIINSSLSLKQGKIVFSEVETLTELYKQTQVMVNAICTLHFLRKLVDNNKLKDFFQTQVHERYLIEYKQGEFREFYDLLDDESKLELRNKSPFKIMCLSKQY